MIPGTSKILSKSGPGDLLIITKMLQKIQEKYGIILEKYYFVNMGLKNFENFRNLYVLGTICFRFFRLFRFFVFCEI